MLKVLLGLLFVAGCLGTDEDIEWYSLPIKQEKDKSSFLSYAFDSTLGKCVNFTDGGCGGNANCFERLEDCTKTCDINNTNVCSQKIEPGPCRAIVPRYAFDSTLGKCVNFTYGGCGGNKNRFEKLEDCTKTCEIDDTDICSQKIDLGSCKGRYSNWGFDSTLGKCVNFAYTGCGGNKNRFVRLEDCKKTCDFNDPSACSLKLEPGPCKGSITKWAYDFKRDKCKKFIYGGCGGNKNRFPRQEDCKKVCVKADFCSLPMRKGPCWGKLTRWGFDAKRGECVKFSYGGCFGNKNQFRNYLDCVKTCDITKVCSFPIKPGRCNAIIPSWGYDVKQGKCVAFTYGGCDSNGNRFDSLEDCERLCS